MMPANKILQTLELGYGETLQKAGLVGISSVDPASTDKNYYFFRWDRIELTDTKLGLENRLITENTYTHTISLHIVFAEPTKAVELTDLTNNLVGMFNNKTFVIPAKQLLAEAKFPQELYWGRVSNAELGDLQERDNVDSSRSAIITFSFMVGLKI